MTMSLETVDAKPTATPSDDVANPADATVRAAAPARQTCTVSFMFLCVLSVKMAQVFPDDLFELWPIADAQKTVVRIWPIGAQVTGQIEYM